ncbi:flavin reductase family protein [Aquihabitans daechungensis]|uniref:flavin reductase family protein n=1 Tax=Aquihabitans daechungensis TaxID=1052257 RepID=UPI003B9EA9FC
MTGSPEPADLDRDQFDALMADIDQPMIIVTTASGGVRAGCLVGFHAQCGIDPVEYAVWLSKANHTYRVGALSEHFAVHFLSPDHHDLAELFGGRTQGEIDKFERCDWTAGPDGVPLLDGVANRFVGRRRAWLDPGADHVCLVLQPVLAEHAGSGDWLRLADASDIDAGHDAEERQRPT